jgi:hypothetical protein
MLPTPISPADALALIVAPALAMLPDRMNSPEARVMLIAIALQESALTHRKQIGGPARGLWQFEQGGGVAGVLRHPASKSFAARVCAARGVVASPVDVYYSLERDDLLACAFARLLLWTDAAPLPPVLHTWRAWDYYLRTWRPGQPHASRWGANHDSAVAAVTRPCDA